VGPGAILAGTVAWSAAMVHSSSRNPAKATMMGCGLFAAVKQRADSVPPPKVSSANSNNNQPMLSLVTGANSGIGRALSLELARQGHLVLMACRSQKRCEDAKATLVEELVAEAATNEDDDTGGVKDGLAALAALRASLEAQVVPVSGMDLSNTQAMVEFARGPVATAATQLRSISSSSLTSSSSSTTSSPASAPAAAIDLLVLNAGFIPAGNTTFPSAGGGWEAGLGAMHLGHFALVTTLAEMGLVSSSSSSSSSGSEMGEVVKSAGGGGDGGGARNGGRSSSGSANNNIKGEEGTVAIVVSSDLSRLGGFHESILTSIHRKTSGGDGSMQQQQGEGPQQGGSKQAQGYEGDLRGEVTNALWSLGPWRIVPNSQGLLNVHSGMPDGVSFGAYSRSKLANVFFARFGDVPLIIHAHKSFQP
jgi:NAD(P)-dependent dehydrogenase (short-subunit alcohol dehydrogenase family)